MNQNAAWFNINNLAKLTARVAPAKRADEPGEQHRTINSKIKDLATQPDAGEYIDFLKQVQAGWPNPQTPAGLSRIWTRCGQGTDSRPLLYQVGRQDDLLFLSKAQWLLIGTHETGRWVRQSRTGRSRYGKEGVQ